jgi:3-phosphoshikimate 1-carboxyvinyltransferase
MTSLRIKPSTLQGELTIPPSKSHTLRALVFAMMAKSKTVIYDYLDSPDTIAMGRALSHFGSKVTFTEKRIEVEPAFQPSNNVINAANSGQVLRFIGALAALQPTYTLLTGDRSICYNRPVKPLLEGLEQLGAFAASSRGDGFAPIIIRGPMKAGKTALDGKDSQPVSGLLIAAAFLEGTSEISVRNPGEKPWIDLTLHWFDKLGIRYKNENYAHYTLYGNTSYPGFEMQIPGDFSSAAFPIVGALITHSELTLHSLDMRDVQGDKKLIDLLIRMGAKIEVQGTTLTVRKSSRLIGTKIDVNDLIDALPILAVVGCYAEGITEIINGEIARRKESDRIHAIATELQKMGARIEEKKEGLLIHSSSLHGAKLASYNDHRIALSLAIAALGAKGESEIEGIQCIAKTYPHFIQDFQAIGARFL